MGAQYNKLRKLPAGRKTKGSALTRMAGAPAPTIAKLSHDEYVSLEISERCRAFHCGTSGAAGLAGEAEES